MQLFKEIETKIANSQVNVTSKIKKFQILVGEYFYPVKGEYCEVGAKNLETGEIGVIIFIHCGDIDKFKNEVDNADWIISCFLPTEYISKSPFGKEATGKVNFAKVKGEHLCVYLGGTHYEEIKAESVSEQVILPEYVNIILKLNSDWIKKGVKSVTERIKRIASAFSCMGKDIRSIAATIWAVHFKKLNVSWDRFKSIF